MSELTLPEKVQYSIRDGQAFTGEIKVSVSPIKTPVPVELSYDADGYTVNIGVMNKATFQSPYIVINSVVPADVPAESKPVVHVAGTGKATICVEGNVRVDASGPGRTPENTRVISRPKTGAVVFQPEAIKKP